MKINNPKWAKDDFGRFAEYLKEKDVLPYLKVAMYMKQNFGHADGLDNMTDEDWIGAAVTLVEILGL
jgi:hypothetical protein